MFGGSENADAAEPLDEIQASTVVSFFDAPSVSCWGQNPALPLRPSTAGVLDLPILLY